MKFNPEEISLCKQVAEKYRKPIKYGDRFIDKNGDIQIWIYRCFYIPNPTKDVLPLWTISDCLEFLREKGYKVKLDEDFHIKFEEPFSTKCYGHESKEAFQKYGKTDNEACLKAVLAVLEDKS